MGPNGAPDSKSSLSSFLFSGMPSPFFDEQRQRQQQQGEEEAERQKKHRAYSQPTLQSHLLPPSLLGDNGTNSNAHESPRSATVLPPPPRRTWSISNDDQNALPAVPSHYPPFDPRCTALVTDAPPSIVVVRIAECLRRRSIAVEYDDESVVARCTTVDRVRFEVRLYRTSPQSEAPRDATIVEVRKTDSSGSGMSFHAARRKILGAAKGLDTGDDERPGRFRNGAEFKPLSKRGIQLPPSIGSNKTKRPKTLADQGAKQNSGPWSFSKTPAYAEESLEAALNLLRKDRWDCQRLGMERLVDLTTPDSVGREICRYVSERLLLQEQETDEDSSGSPPKKNHGWRLIDSLMHPSAEQAPEFDSDDDDNGSGDAEERNHRASVASKTTHSGGKNDQRVRSFFESSALSSLAPSPRRSSSIASPSSLPLTRGGRSFLQKRSPSLYRRSSSAGAVSGANEASTPEEIRHEARLRSLAMRVFCNSLDNLSKTGELQEVLYPTARNETNKVFHTKNSNSSPTKTETTPSRWVQPALVLSLLQDLQGAGRPPSVSESGYKLASVHEAAMAARCLRLLAGYESGDDDEDRENELETEGNRGASHRKHESNNNNNNNSAEKHREVLRGFLRSEAVLERLEYARSCGRATHAILQREAELTYNRLTEVDRSC
eukprot:CAMPEP_0201118558 /NCGR_PEP_ID=MMETSP0850-20130426/2768_1 /ASSEMBLY_ACC=CAM_ASM_000622 /TAXON_ID=183588 /ORGANISM="Pseudo-nitzschia fraudulenta, Strain WWA7" /LENGTH=661 /DNA_ID=CAMNT_0047383869 /DNA_START=223 /DNA_END=2208 /DNA_ORIENTATION=-